MHERFNRVVGFDIGLVMQILAALAVGWGMADNGHPWWMPPLLWFGFQLLIRGIYYIVAGSRRLGHYEYVEPECNDAV